MTSKLVALVLLCLMSGTAMAQEPKVTSLMSKDLTENPGREVLMITVEHAPGGSSDPPTQCTSFCLCTGGLRCNAADVHVVDRNASATNPAKFLVFLIKDKGAPALVPVQ
jgi:hypothetical protein